MRLPTREGRYLVPGLPWDGAGLERGDHLVIGTIADGSAEPPAAGPPHQAAPGVVAISRSPRTHHRPMVHHVDLPQVPDETTMRGSGHHWQIVAGLGLGATAVVTGLALPGLRWLAIAGALTSILGVLATVMADRSRQRFQHHRFQERLADLDRELAAVRVAQARALDECHPDVETLRPWIQERGERLWERRRGDADFLALRLGTGRRPSMLDSTAAPARSGPRAADLAATLAGHAWLDAAPITLPGDSAVTGVAGRGQSLVRSLLLQAAALHAPADLAIAAVAGSPSWAWTRWLPHVLEGPGALVAWDASGADTLAGSLARRVRDRSDGRRLLVVIDADVAQRPSALALVAAIRGAPGAGCTPSSSPRTAVTFLPEPRRQSSWRRVSPGSRARGRRRAPSASPPTP
ncbi:MAG TPA: hypothetical protein VET24_09370 [Actinomycetota bacterium]|nr:hypothetical protein [Actinomycetota bacterium]